MRRQELIYAQVDGFARNKDILNVSTSSDICVFEAPTFQMTGATKIVTGITSGDTGIYLVDNYNSVFNLVFDFNSTSLSNDTIFNANIYKFNDYTNVFENNVVKTLGPWNEDDFVSNMVTENVLFSDFTNDSQYLLKPVFDNSVCTGILGRLGLRTLTNTFQRGLPFNSYNSKYDYYFAIITEANLPIFDLSPQNERPIGAINVVTIIPTGETTFMIEDGYSGAPVITLNGSVLAPDEDYVLSGNTFTLNDVTVEDDIMTIFYVGAGNFNGLVSSSYTILGTIASGPMNGEGNNTVYFNEDTGKFEFYTDTNPTDGNEVVISLNGAILASQIDYYQSTTNKRRFILEGDLIVGDIITVVYNGQTTYNGSIRENSPIIYWTLEDAPKKTNGKFILQLADSKDFANILFSTETPYVVGNKVYNAGLEISGSVGTKVYYRVVSKKDFVLVSGDIITSETVSEIIPLTIQSNSLNSY